MPTLEAVRDTVGSTLISWRLDTDPTVFGVDAADIGDLLVRTDVPSLYFKSGILGTSWTQIGTGLPEGANQALVYQPGGVGIGPVVFADWASLYARLVQLRAGSGIPNGGIYTIVFDDSIVTPAVVPVGVWDMVDVTWSGTNRLGAGGGVIAVQLADGVRLPGLRHFVNGLWVYNLCTLTPPIDLVSGDLITISLCYLDSVVGGAPFYSAANLVAGEYVLVQMIQDSQIGFSDVGPVFDFPVPGTVLSLIIQSGSYIANAGVLVGVVGTLLTWLIDSTFSIPVLTAWAGAINDPFQSDPPSLIPRPYLLPPSAVPIASAQVNDLVRIDASGGAVVQFLPNISAPFPWPGTFFALAEVGGGDGLVAQSAPVNTINGSHAPYPIGPRQCVIFMSDGIDNWIPVGASQVVTSTNDIPGRVANVAFQPSLTHDCLVKYDVKVTAGVLGVGAGDGTIDLLCNAENPPTVRRDWCGTAGTAVAVGTVYGSVSFLVPKGWWVMLSVTPVVNVAVAIGDQVEQLLYHP